MPLPIYDETNINVVGDPNDPDNATSARARLVGPKLADIFQQLTELTDKPIDYSGVQEAARARTAAAKRDMTAGMALQALGGRQLAPVGEMIMRQALADSGPLRANAADVGYTNPETGLFVENPLMARQHSERRLLNMIAGRQRAESDMERILISQGRVAEANALRAQQRARNEALDAFRERQFTEAARHNKAMEGIGSERVKAAAAQAAQKGEEMPPATAKEYRENSTSLQDVQETLDMLTGGEAEAAKRGIGWVGFFPEWSRGWIDPAGVPIRARIARVGSTKIHDLSGATTTVAEMPRFAPFIPNLQLDSAETIKKKMQGFAKEYEAVLRAIEAGYPLSKLTKRMNASPPPVPPGAASTPITPPKTIKWGDLK